MTVATAEPAPREALTNLIDSPSPCPWRNQNQRQGACSKRHTLPWGTPCDCPLESLAKPTRQCSSQTPWSCCRWTDYIQRNPSTVSMNDQPEDRAVKAPLSTKPKGMIVTSEKRQRHPKIRPKSPYLQGIPSTGTSGTLKP